MQVSGEKKMNLPRIKKNKALSKCSFFRFHFVVYHPSSRLQVSTDFRSSSCEIPTSLLNSNQKLYISIRSHFEGGGVGKVTLILTSCASVFVFLVLLLIE